MSDGTKIEWTDATWNPITGCSVVSAGCRHCYAMKLAGTRLQHHPSRAGLTIDTAAGPVWNGVVRFNEQWLRQPLQWRRPRRIFVCAHGDLFHENVPFEWIDRVLTVTVRAPHHVFQILTKRADRMRQVMQQWTDMNGRTQPNLWLGVSVEDQAAADARIPLLLQTPAAVRWISAEPLLGAVDLRRWLPHEYIDAEGRDYRAQDDSCAICGVKTNALHWTAAARSGIDWVVVGGESGANARPMHPEWARSLRDQCDGAGVPFLFKQWGEWTPGVNVERRSGTVKTADWFGNKWVLGKEDLAYEDGHADDEPDLYHVGKKAAGRLLDGVQHDGYPEAKP